MRPLIALSVLGAILLASATASAQSHEVVCGRILGHTAPTATAPGEFVIVRPGDAPAPAGGTRVTIAQGTQFTAPEGWVCARVLTVPNGTRTFVGFVGPGSPGYVPEPTAPPRPAGAPGISPPKDFGSLPSTSTSR